MKIKDAIIPPGLRLLDQINQLPDDEVFEGAELAVKCNISADAVRRLAGSIPLNVVRLGVRNYYGSMKAVKAFKAHHKLS